MGRAKSCLNQKSCLKWTCLKQKTTVLLTSQTLNANALWNQEVIRFRNTSRALRTKAWNVSFPEFREFRREFRLESLIWIWQQKLEFGIRWIWKPYNPSFIHICCWSNLGTWILLFAGFFFHIFHGQKKTSPKVEFL